MSIPGYATANAAKFGPEAEFQIRPNLPIENSSFDTAANLGAIPAAVDDYVTVKHYGNGVINKSVFTITALPITITDNGANGSGGTKIFDFANGNLCSLVASTNMTVAYGSVTDANVIASVGTSVAAADATLTSAEANIVPSTAAATTSGAGTFAGQNTAIGYHDGTATAAPIYVNLATSTDPSTNNSATVSGTLTMVWALGGDN